MFQAESVLNLRIGIWRLFRDSEFEFRISYGEPQGRHPVGAGFVNMRRKKFWKVITREEAQALFEDVPRLEEETVELGHALGRIAARDLSSPTDVPHFARSSMDGFAVKASDTYGATETSPVILRVIGEIPVGDEAIYGISDGETLEISTGGMLPPYADAVLMVEYTTPSDGGTIEVTKAVAPGENITQIGEDIRKGSPLLKKGKRVRAQDIGGLASVGIIQVPVVRRPRVGILSTGDELVSPDHEPGLGQVRAVNSCTLSALTVQYGASPADFGIVRDSYDWIKESLHRALRASDVVVISGGSSVGTHDMTLDVIQSFEESRILAHGLAIRPGKPTIIAQVGGKAVFGLPGHPVSAMIVFAILVKYVIHQMVGHCDGLNHRQALKVRIAQNIASVSGREDYVRVSLEKEGEEVLARPILGKSAAISTLVRADGLVRIPLEKEGLEAGEVVEVELW